MSTVKKRLLVYIMMFGSLIVSVKLSKDIFQLWHADDKIVKAEAELKMAKDEQEELKLALEKAGGDFWREAQVRNTLKMAKPNEVVVVIPEEVTKKRRDEPAYTKVSEGEELSNWQKWLKLLMY